MHKYLSELTNYGQYKILAGLWATIYSDNLPILFLLFVIMELLDIYTRWLALSYDCFKSLYPQTPCNLYRAATFMWQARKWRWIKSTGLREGFCDKMLTYLLLLTLAAVVDGALAIARMPRGILLAAVVTVLSTTEALSILENLGECNVQAIAAIKEQFKKAVNKER